MEQSEISSENLKQKKEKVLEVRKWAEINQSKPIKDSINLSPRNSSP